MRRLLLTLPTVLAGVPLLATLMAASHGSPEAPLAAEVTALPLAIEDGVSADDPAMEKLAREDPCAFLEKCLVRYRHEVKGYTMRMQKQESIGGRLQPVEITDVCFREEPFSVYLSWVEGARKAERVLYVQGENDGKLLARPSGALVRRLVGSVVERDVDSDEARQSGRFTIDHFGLKKSMERTLTTWKAARDAGALHVEYLGIKNIRELHDRPCYVLHRTCDRPEGDGVTEQTIYVDTETWLQTGSIARGAAGQIIGEYYFRDVKLNPDFRPDQFTKAALTP